MLDTNECSLHETASSQSTISGLNLKIPLRRRAASLEERFLMVQVKHSDADVTIRCRKYPTGERVQFYCHRSVLAQKSLYFREKNSFEQRRAELPCVDFAASNSFGSADLARGVGSGVAGYGESSSSDARYARCNEFSEEPAQMVDSENRAVIEEFLLDDYDDDVVYEVLRYIYCGTFCPPVGFSRRFPMLLSLIDYLGLCQQNPAPLWSVYDNSNNWGRAQQGGASVAPANGQEGDEGGMLGDCALTDYLKNTPIDKLKDLLRHSDVFGSPHHGRGGLGFSLRAELIERLVKLRSEDMTVDTLGGDLYHRMTRAGGSPSMSPVAALGKVLPIPVFVWRFVYGTILEKCHVNPSETLRESLKLPPESILWYVSKKRSEVVSPNMTLEGFGRRILSWEEIPDTRVWLAPPHFVVEPQLLADIFKCCFRRALLRPVDDSFVDSLKASLVSSENKGRNPHAEPCEQIRLLWKATREQIMELTLCDDVRMESVVESDPFGNCPLHFWGIEPTSSTQACLDESPLSALPAAHVQVLTTLDVPMDTNGDTPPRTESAWESSHSPLRSANGAPGSREPSAIPCDGEEERGAPSNATEYMCGGNSTEMDVDQGTTPGEGGTRSYVGLPALDPDVASWGDNRVDSQSGMQNVTDFPDMALPWKKIRIDNLNMQHSGSIPPWVSLEVEHEDGTQLTIQLVVVSCGAIPRYDELFSLAHVEVHLVLQELEYSRSRTSRLDRSWMAFAKITPAPDLPGVCPRTGFVRALLVGASLTHLCFSLQRALRKT
eukprot:GEMP01011410.1.p1 GENE.GEMP01011410.1~~GEMP01011410.1.p1  ORF type:complete len:777 (+),score=175.33 GEMP01011410.1:256-2586(+)